MDSLEASTAENTVNLPRFASGIREFFLGMLNSHLEISHYDRLRAVDSAWVARSVLESQGQPLPATPMVYISETELEAFHRFCDCCEDSCAGGHDVSKEMMARLVDAGLVRSQGFGRHTTTRFGDAVRAQRQQ